jgi:DNA polymerase
LAFELAIVAGALVSVIPSEAPRLSRPLVVAHQTVVKRPPKDRPAAKDHRRPPIPPNLTLPKLQDAARNCRACDLWRNATQTVFGAGPSRAKIMLIGEQPGNNEDLDGRPFVGPAGKLLDRALIEAGIDRTEVYVTNAVKHFKWEPRGKRRIHKKPNSAEIAACRPWLEAEIAVVRPQVIICMGATAAQSLLGSDFRVTQHRGEFLESPLAPAVTVTIHPSAILRAPDEETRRIEFAKFVADLKNTSKRR